MSMRRLHPHIQHGIVNELGWRGLRPVQEQSIDAVLDGANTIILAPTAGGKTEAAFFPALSRVLTDGSAPVSVLVVCPIRALLNNQEERLTAYARMVGLDVFKWHGDVSASVKERFRRAPTHVLLTTPESIEVMLISAKTDARALFAGLTTVIVDEVHALAGDDRGAHLLALLERLTVFCGRDLQRIGLSATVGNPMLLSAWLQGSSIRPRRVINPPRSPVSRSLRVELVEGLPELATGLAAAAPGKKKSLVFVESRARAERVAQAMSGMGVEVFIHHSSVSREERALAEERFTRGQNTAIVATSTLELGIDVGDLDQVLQVDAPATVASLLQRLGRAGRRAGAVARGAFFCTSPESLLQAVALLRLADSGWVEDVAPAEDALHLLAHQLMALTLQEGGVSRHRALPWVASAWPFASVREVHAQRLIDTMVERDILSENDGLLSLGLKGEALYGRKNFFELYAVFCAPPSLRVMHGREEVGQVSASFVQGAESREGPLCFRLGGRAWRVVRADWSRGVVMVEPSDRGQVPTWLGLGGVLSWEVCQEMRRVLIAPGVEAQWLSREASMTLADLRVGYEGLLEPGHAPLEDHGDSVQWHTFAGGEINRLLSAGLEHLTGDRWIAGNLSLKQRGGGVAKAREALRGLTRLDWEGLAIARGHQLSRGRLSKFQPCLPEEAEDRLLAERLLDVPGALRFLARTRIGGLSAPLPAASSVRVELALVEPAQAEPTQAEPTRAEPTLAKPSGAAPIQTKPIQTKPIQAGPSVFKASLPVVAVVDEAGVAAICAELLREPIVAIDVETTLTTHALCLIQLGVRDRVVIIDPLGLADLEALRPLLMSPTVVKIAHNAVFERGVFAKLGIELVNVFDTLRASRAARGSDAPGGHSLGAVCARELGVTLDKTEQTSPWARRPLTRAQLAYAAADVEVLLPLYDRLRPLASPLLG